VPDTKFNGKGELWANMTKRKARNGGTTQGMSRTRKRKVGSAQDKKPPAAAEASDPIPLEG
jgi:hypothetical protein